jgi:hypothetical protein
MAEELTYQSYNDDSLIVFGNRNKFQRNMNVIGGRWNSRKDGWIVPIINKNKLDNFISSLKKSDDEHVDTRKKYHREDSEVEDSDEEETVTESKKNVSRESSHDRKLRDNHAKRKYGNHDPMVYNRPIVDGGVHDENPYSYYKSFNKKPVDFRKEHDISDSEDSEDLESSTDEDSSSSDGFPSPGTPRKRDGYAKNNSRDLDYLYHTVRDLQKRMGNIENANRR